MTTRTIRTLCASLAALILLPVLALAADAPLTPPRQAPVRRILRFPDIYGDTIVFSHGGDLWTVNVDGGEARRLTSGDGLELFPRFSPDGKWIAFTASYDGSFDVYVIPSHGGDPRRLTWYPAQDNNDRMGFDNMVIGWTPDGKILFRSQRGAFTGFVGQPWVVSPDGGAPERFPLPESGIITFSPDGKRIAYNRNFRDFRTWKRYQGGQAQDVWIYDLGAKSLERLTDWAGTDTEPMWIGNEGALGTRSAPRGSPAGSPTGDQGAEIYYVSDRVDWKLNLWKSDLATKQATQVTKFTEFDVKWPHAGPGPDAKPRIVFENGGDLYLLDPATDAAKKITVRIPDDEKLTRKHWISAENYINDWAMSPDGKRGLFAARGDVFTVPVEHGPTRNLTQSPLSRERDVVWSPDGKWVGYLSDATGEEEIWIAAQDGKRAPIQVTKGSDSWHFQPLWSPDSKKFVWSDRKNRLWYVDIESKKPVLVDTATVWEIEEYTWSPDSKWIAYTKQVENLFPSIFLYSLDTKKSTQATRALERCASPVFDPEGKYLYMLTDRDLHPTLGNFETDYVLNNVTRPAAITLTADEASPFAPQSDEVGAKSDDEEKDEKDEKKDKKGAKGKDKDKAAAKPVKIDLAGIEGRVVVFPVTPGTYRGLRAAKGKVYWLSGQVQDLNDPNAVRNATLVQYDLEERKSHELLRAIDGYDLAPDGAKLMWQRGHAWYIADAKSEIKDEKKLDVSGLRLELDPRAEWRQIFNEVWRVERDFFYLPSHDSIDWPAMRKRYEPLLADVSHRADLTYVLSEMAGELGTGHSYLGGGDQPRPERSAGVGLIGCDFAADAKAGRWRIARIIPGENWDDSRRSPLTEPGIKVSEGDYLLAVNGHELRASENPYAAFANTAGGTVTLTVNAKPALAGSHEITVRTLASETDLRYYDWVESNRKYVDRKTGGRVGYVHIPDMGGGGLAEFARQFYPQLRKQGLVVDVRANGGGFVSQMILERLARRPVGMGAALNGLSGSYPDSAFNGPMACILNMYSASDGDIFPYFFRQYKLGPLIGTRSWGGTTGIRGLGGNLVDGGYVFVPEFGMYNLKSQWIIENYGVPPDIEVDNLPADEMAGKDAQLDRAIDEVEARIRANPPVWPPRPPDPNVANPPVRHTVEVPPAK